MFCIKCGKQLPDEAAFCFACGAPVYKEGGNAPAAPSASVFENATAFTTMAGEGNPGVSEFATVTLGDFFVDDDTIYFLTHDFDWGHKTKLCAKNCLGGEVRELLSFDDLPYSIHTDPFIADTVYLMAKTENLILFKVYDADNNFYNYFYQIDTHKHGILKDVPLLPEKISEDGRYFISNNRVSGNEDDGIYITLTTPAEALMGAEGKKIVLNRDSLFILYDRYKEVRLDNFEYFVYDYDKLLVPLVCDSEYIFARFNLFDLTDFKLLKPANFSLPGTGMCFFEGSSVILRDGDTFRCVLVDTQDMSVRAQIPMDYPGLTLYGSLLYCYSYRVDHSLLLDMKTGTIKKLPQYVKSFDGAHKYDICQTENGFYKYYHKNGETKIYFLSKDELFRPCNEYYDDNECVLPIVHIGSEN